LIPSVAGDLTPGEQLSTGNADGTNGRIDDDHREPSPSTDWRELYRILGVTPPDEPCTHPPETLARMERTARRHDHVRFL